MQAPIIDSHAHIYGEDFPDLSEVVERAQLAGVTKVLLPNIDAKSIPELVDAQDKHPHFFELMLGLHPTSVGAQYQEELQLIRTQLFSAPDRYIAVGEIGLDYYWDTTYQKEMMDAFVTQLHWAMELQKPVSIHARDAVMDAIQAIKEVGAKQLSGVFHSFTGNQQELEEALALENFMIGVNGIITFKNNELPHLFKQLLPLHRIVVETDAPYLSPVPKRGKRNESSHLSFVIDKLSEIYETPMHEVTKQLYHNTLSIFKMRVTQ